MEADRDLGRDKIRKASLESGFKPPVQGSEDEKRTLQLLNQLEEAFLMLHEIKLPPGHDIADLSINQPIQLDGNCDDPRLRRDEIIPSPLTPEEVAQSFCFIDKDTGMPKIPVKPDLYPWEIVSHL